MFLMAWLILANSLLAPQAAADTPERKLLATVDARVELMSIIFRLAGHPEYNMANSKSPYADEVEQQFGSLRNHPAVKYAQELRSRSGISYDAVMSLAVHVNDALELKEKIQLVEEPELTAAKRTRQAVIEIVTKDGTPLREHGISRGTVENPMTAEEVEEKSRELMTPVLGKERSEELINTIWNLERVKNMRKLRPLLSPPPGGSAPV